MSTRGQDALRGAAGRTAPGVGKRAVRPALTRGRVARYALLGLGMTALAFVRFGGEARPLAFGLYAAAVYAGYSVFALTPLFLAGSLLAAPSVGTLIMTLPLALVLTVAMPIHKAYAKNPAKPLFFAYTAVGQAGTLFVAFAHGVDRVGILVTVIFGFVVLYAALQAINALAVFQKRGGFLKSELGCLGLMVIALFCGVASLPAPVGGYALRLLAVAASLVSMRVCGAGYGVAVALLAGLGGALSLRDFAFAGGFACIVLAAAAFCDLPRWASSLAALLAEVVVGVYFSPYVFYTLWYLLAVAGGCLVYCLIPKNAVRALTERFGTTQYYAPRHMVNRTRAALHRRLSEVARVFGDMDVVFASLARGGEGVKEARTRLLQQLPQRLCGGCANAGQCHKACTETTAAAFAAVVDAAVQKGGAHMLDVPPFLSARCLRMHALLSQVNAEAPRLAAAARRGGALDGTRLLLAEQLGGVSRLLQRLADEVHTGVAFDREGEQRLQTELLYADIACREVVVSGNGAHTDVSLVVAGGYTHPRIEDIAAKTLKNPLMVARDEPGAMPGTRALLLKPRPAFDAAYGAADSPKLGNRASGDVYSFLKAGDDVFLAALVDGMGAGERARAMAASALSLLEAFYRAGFDNETILSAVNKLLTLSGEEMFAAVDLCVVHLSTGETDLIKIGAPFGVVKCRAGSERVEGASLPMGMLDEMTPAARRYVLSAGDMVVMCTDGVTDTLGDNLLPLVASCAATHPQELASYILDEAVRCDRFAPHDDMTVVAVRVV